MIKILWDYLENKLIYLEPVICQVTLKNDLVIEFRCDRCKYITNERIVQLIHDNMESYFYIDDIVLLEFKEIPSTEKEPETKNEKEKDEYSTLITLGDIVGEF